MVVLSSRPAVVGCPVGREGAVSTVRNYTVQLHLATTIKRAKACKSCMVFGSTYKVLALSYGTEQG